MRSFRPAIVTIFAAILFCGLTPSWLLGQDLGEASGDAQIIENLRIAREEYFVNANYKKSSEYFQLAHQRAVRLWGKRDWRSEKIELGAIDSRLILTLTPTELDQLHAAIEKNKQADELVHAKHDNAAALLLFAEAEPTIAKLLGEDSYSWSFLAMQYSQCLADAGRMQEAQEILNQAIEVRARLLGSDHPLTVLANSLYAYNDYRLRNYEEAEVRWVQCRLALEQSNLQETTYYGDILMGLADIKIARGQPRAAIPYMQRSIAILEKATEHQAEKLARSSWTLAKALRITNDLPGAQREIERAQRWLAKSEGYIPQLGKHVNAERDTIVREVKRSHRYPDLQ